MIKVTTKKKMNVMSCHSYNNLLSYHHCHWLQMKLWKKEQSSSSIRQTNVEGEKEKTEDMTKNVGDIGDYRKKVQGVLKRSEK